MLSNIKEALKMYVTKPTRQLFKQQFPPKGIDDAEYTGDINFGKSLVSKYIKPEERLLKEWHKNDYGEWIQGEHDSKGRENGRILRISFGGLYIERYINGVRNGSGTELDHKGVSTGIYTDGKKTGTWIN